MKKLADSLKLHARRLGLTDADVARRSGLSEVRYGHYVRGRSEPDLATLLRICKVLNITPNDLLLRIDDKPLSVAKTGKRDETKILRGRITADVARLNKKQLRMVSKMLNALCD